MLIFVRDTHGIQRNIVLLGNFSKILAASLGLEPETSLFVQRRGFSLQNTPRVVNKTKSLFSCLLVSFNSQLLGSFFVYEFVSWLSTSNTQIMTMRSLFFLRFLKVVVAASTVTAVGLNGFLLKTF